ncbi:alginate export family protein [Coraliomargarita akajimensis]|uniref:Alginate export domain-containing protein n=1 Tax=Coraliomargarita akajimensis (strain DSM 45221 / IAM 15411 / JCM 23193 / KCTC 12865 / 04OKA010-24) TaxID=583355 RepID=D5EIZ3_CORAD|nr:alginate export family protein [Coraliomargarita akajimensis]ADE54392.1 conserved hypothetical protein [Coraliomargarita akajimensis DSM 45221]
MKITKTTSLLSALTLAGGASLFAAGPGEEELGGLFSKLEETVPGKFNLNYRIRYEGTETTSDTDGISHRIRYGYTTDNYYGFTGMIEGETLTSIDGGFNGLDEAGTGTEVNQLWGQYANEDYGKAKLGRQIYTLDDHRFVGHVGWRQNIQTFDAFTAEFSGVEKLSLKAFYIGQINRVNDEFIDTDTFGLNASYAFAPEAKLTAFYYNIDGTDAPRSGFDSQTLGARFTGAAKLGESKLSYALSYAYQDGYTVNDVGTASYYAADVKGALFKTGLSLGLGVEVLETGFRTPLATVHKFNGFADKFAVPSLAGGLTTGLQDYYASLSYKLGKTGLSASFIYHYFTPNTGSGDGGNEFDLVGKYALNKYVSFIGKYGDYQAASGATGAFAGDKKIYTLEMNFVY